MFKRTLLIVALTLGLCVSYHISSAQDVTPEPTEVVSDALAQASESVDPSAAQVEQTTNQYQGVLDNSDGLLKFMISWLISGLAVAQVLGATNQATLKSTWIPFYTRLVNALGVKWEDDMKLRLQLIFTAIVTVIISFVEVVNGAVIFGDNPFLAAYELSPALRILINVALLTIATFISEMQWDFIKAWLNKGAAIVDIISPPNSPVTTVQVKVGKTVTTHDFQTPRSDPDFKTGPLN